MEALLVVGDSRYRLWTPNDEEREFHPMVRKYSKEIFGESSLYFDLKHVMKSLSGIGSIPDAYVISLQEPSEWFVVENELARHPVYDHIVRQLTKFINGIENQNTRNEILDTLYDEISKDNILRKTVEKSVCSTDIYRFLSKLFSKKPRIVIIIDEKTSEIEEACGVLKYRTDIVEFKTYVREDDPNSYAHLFEPLSQAEEIEKSKMFVTSEKTQEKGETEEQERYTESFHLEDVKKSIVAAYENIKNSITKLDPNIKINPQKYYISLRKNRNFAYIDLRKKKMHIVVMLPYDSGEALIKKHKLIQLSEGIQTFYNGDCFKVTIENEENLDEITKALEEAYRLHSVKSLL